MEKTNVVIAIDGVQMAQEVIDYYMKHVHRDGNHIILCHVIQVPDWSHAKDSCVSPSSLQKEFGHEKEKYLQIESDLRRIMKEHGITDVKIRLDNSMKVGQKLCEVSDAEKASLIVVGTHSAGKLKRTISESVADHLVQHANCPVVICRREKHKHHADH